MRLDPLGSASVRQPPGRAGAARQGHPRVPGLRTVSVAHAYDLFACILSSQRDSSMYKVSADCLRNELPRTHSGIAYVESRGMQSLSFASLPGSHLSLADSRSPVTGAAGPLEALGELPVEPQVRPACVCGTKSFGWWMHFLYAAPSHSVWVAQLLYAAPRHMICTCRAQVALCKEVSAALGFDFERGRIDVSVHPFTGGYVRAHADHLMPHTNPEHSIVQL
jgi:hypothetical protein